MALMKTLTPTGIDFLDAEDMTGTAVFLASDDSKMTHGETILVDGGWAVWEIFSIAVLSLRSTPNFGTSFWGLTAYKAVDSKPWYGAAHREKFSSTGRTGNFVFITAEGIPRTLKKPGP